MMYEAAERLKKEFHELFPDSLSFRQFWWLTKLCKGVRLYCRTNVAFNDFMNAVFLKKAGFEQVMKENANKGEYSSLKITVYNKDGSEESGNLNGGEGV